MSVASPGRLRCWRPGPWPKKKTDVSKVVWKCIRELESIGESRIYLQKTCVCFPQPWSFHDSVCSVHGRKISLWESTHCVKTRPTKLRILTMSLAEAAAPFDSSQVFSASLLNSCGCFPYWRLLFLAPKNNTTVSNDDRQCWGQLRSVLFACLSLWYFSSTAWNPRLGPRFLLSHSQVFFFIYFTRELTEWLENCLPISSTVQGMFWDLSRPSHVLLYLFLSSFTISPPLTRFYFSFSLAPFCPSKRSQQRL